MLTGKFHMDAGGVLLVRCGDGEDSLRVGWSQADSSLSLWRASRLLEKVDCRLPPELHGQGGFVDVAVSLIDQQVIVALAGQPWLRYELMTPLAASARPFAIGVRDASLAIEDLTVWRDVIYTPLPGGKVKRDSTEATWELAGREYFVLGDNAAISEDSRTWRHGPGLKSELLVGSPIGIP
jgi:hypothetical protein